MVEIAEDDVERAIGAGERLLVLIGVARAVGVGSPKVLTRSGLVVLTTGALKVSA